jgi:hypothetical protein
MYKWPFWRLQILGELIMSSTIASATLTSATATATLGIVDGHTHFSPYGYTPSAAANITFLVIFRWFYSLLLSNLKVS